MKQIYVDEIGSNKRIVEKFQNFLNRVVRQSTQKDDLSLSMRVSQAFQNKSAWIVSSHESVSERRRSSIYMNQMNLLSELNQRIPQRNTIQIYDIQPIIEMEIDPQEYFEKNLKYVIQVQSRWRQRKIYKITQRMLKNLRHRHNVIKELIATEESYNKDLQLIIEVIKQPLLNQEFISKEHIFILFGNIEEIAQMNSSFLSKMQIPKQSDFSFFNEIGLILQNSVQKFSIYFDYYNNYNKSEALYKEFIRTNEQFFKFDQELKKEKILRYLGWAGFLVKPIQRMPKYSLLLKDYIKHIEQDHPLYLVYKNAFDLFQASLEQNDQSMAAMAQHIKLFDLQKYYGDSAQIQILETKRVFHFVERIFIIYENLEKPLQLYGLTDMLLLCEPDEKSETGYKYWKHILLNERSQVHSLPNKRYFSNLTKFIGKNMSIIFISETPEYKEQFIRNLEGLLHKKHQKYNIEVQVIGTEERLQNTFSQYTIYVVNVTIDKIISKLFLRYSDIKKGYDQINKEYPEICLPPFQKASWLGNHESKVIENRKIEIEDFVLSLLVNDTFQSKDKKNQSKVLEFFGLDPNFYQLPDMLKQLSSQKEQNVITSTFQQDNSNRLAKANEERMTSTQLVRKIHEQLQVDQGEKIIVTVLYHNNIKKDLAIPSWYRGFDLIKLVSKEAELQEDCDFRLFETDEDLVGMRPIQEDEIIQNLVRERSSSITKFFSNNKKKCILFRKFLFLPYFYEDEMIQQDPKRLELIIFQVFFDVKRMLYQFDVLEYSNFVALYLIISHRNVIDNKDFPAECLRTIIPPLILKQQKNSTWIEQIMNVYKTMQIQGSQICLLNHRLSQITQATNLGTSELYLKENLEKISENKSTLAETILLNLVYKHPFHGMNIFEVGISSKDFTTIQRYIKQKLNRNVVKDGFALGVSFGKLLFIDILRKQIDFDEMNALSDQLHLSFGGQKYDIRLITSAGFQIMNIIQEYEYLEIELQKINPVI